MGKDYGKRWLDLKNVPNLQFYCLKMTNLEAQFVAQTLQVTGNTLSSHKQYV